MHAFSSEMIHGVGRDAARVAAAVAARGVSVAAVPAEAPRPWLRQRRQSRPGGSSPDVALSGCAPASADQSVSSQDALGSTQT